MKSDLFQPVGLCIFFAAFVLIAAGLAAGPSMALVIAGLLALAVSIVLLHRSKTLVSEE